MAIEAFCYVVQFGNFGGQLVEHLRPALLAGLAFIQQVMPVAEPLAHQGFVHFRVALQGQDFIAPGKRLVAAPGATEQRLCALGNSKAIAMPLEDRELLRHML